MNEKVLKGPSWVGLIITIEQYSFCTAKPSVVGCTPYARCVLQGSRTYNGQSVDHSQLSCPSICPTAYRQTTRICALVNDIEVGQTKVLKRRTCPTA